MGLENILLMTMDAPRDRPRLLPGFPLEMSWNVLVPRSSSPPIDSRGGDWRPLWAALPHLVPRKRTAKVWEIAGGLMDGFTNYRLPSKSTIGVKLADFSKEDRWSMMDRNSD